MAKKNHMSLVAAILMVVTGLLMGAFNPPAAEAAPSETERAEARGQCGGPANSPAQLLRNWKRIGVLDDAARYYGVSPYDESIESMVMRHFGIAILARPMVQTDNKGCSGGSMFDWHNRYKKAGDKMIVDVRPLRAMFPEGFSLTPKPGWKRIAFKIATKGQADCSNFGAGPGWIWVWVKPTPRVVPKPKKPGVVKIVIVKHALTAAAEEQILKPTPTGVFRFRVQCGVKGKPRYVLYQSDPQPAGTCPVKAGRVLIWELTPLGPDKWMFLTGAIINKSPNCPPVHAPCAYQTFKLKGKKVVRVVYKNKQLKEKVTPKSPEDVCPNLPGQQVVIPPGYVKDGAGNCVIPATPTPRDVCPNIPGAQDTVPPGYVLENGMCVLPKTETDVCPNISGIQIVIPPGYVKDGAGNCVIPPPSSVQAYYNCTGLSLTARDNRSVDAAVTYNASNATFQTATFAWGDGTSNTVSGTGASHAYGGDGNFTVVATLTFNVGSTAVTSSCSGVVQIVAPKTTQDMCLNISGIQIVVPPFYNRDGAGNCHPA